MKRFNAMLSALLIVSQILVPVAHAMDAYGPNFPHFSARMLLQLFDAMPAGSPPPTGTLPTWNLYSIDNQNPFYQYREGGQLVPYDALKDEVISGLASEIVKAFDSDVCLHTYGPETCRITQTSVLDHLYGKNRGRSDVEVEISPTFDVRASVPIRTIYFDSAPSPKLTKNANNTVTLEFNPKLYVRIAPLIDMLAAGIWSERLSLPIQFVAALKLKIQNISVDPLQPNQILNANNSINTNNVKVSIEIDSMSSDVSAIQTNIALLGIVGGLIGSAINGIAGPVIGAGIGVLVGVIACAIVEPILKTKIQKILTKSLEEAQDKLMKKANDKIAEHSATINTLKGQVTSMESSVSAIRARLGLIGLATNRDSRVHEYSENTLRPGPGGQNVYTATTMQELAISVTNSLPTPAAGTNEINATIYFPGRTCGYYWSGYGGEDDYSYTYEAQGERVNQNLENQLCNSKLAGQLEAVAYLGSRTVSDGKDLKIVSDFSGALPVEFEYTGRFAIGVGTDGLAAHYSCNFKVKKIPNNGVVRIRIKPNSPLVDRFHLDMYGSHDGAHAASDYVSGNRSALTNPQRDYFFRTLLIGGMPGTGVRNELNLASSKYNLGYKGITNLATECPSGGGSHHDMPDGYGEDWDDEGSYYDSEGWYFWGSM